MNILPLFLLLFLAASIGSAETEQPTAERPRHPGHY